MDYGSAVVPNPFIRYGNSARKNLRGEVFMRVEVVSAPKNACKRREHKCAKMDYLTKIT
jgi:hypothetical protein